MMESSGESITLVRDALHNPDEPRHFMRIVPTEEMFVACIGQTELARSSQTLKLKEVAYDIYDPVIYFPREDVRMALLARTERSTHCPLKGHTEYFDARLPGGSCRESVAWSYVRVIPPAALIDHYIAFDSRLVDVRTEARPPG